MKKKLKGLLSLWLAVVLVLGTPMVPVLAEGVAATSHGEHTDWKKITSGVEELSGYCYMDSGNISFGTTYVKEETTICLHNNNMSNGSGSVNVCSGGNLTMDDCSTSGGGQCDLPFVVNSGGILNIQGGNYYWWGLEDQVKCNGIMNIQGVTYNRKINVENNGELNISTENGRTTEVCIDDCTSSASNEKITGKFNLRNPQKKYSTDVNGKTKIFDSWKVQIVNCGGVVSSNNISANENYTVEDIENYNKELWEKASDGGCLVYLYSDWVDGHTVTYNYNNGLTDKTIGVVSGNSITLAEPTKTGCTFSGWSDGVGNTYKAGASFIPTANTTLTAQWIQNPSSGGVNDPVNPPTSDPTPTTPPSNNSNDKDWNSVKNNVANAKDGDTVNIDLSKDTTVPGDILNSIKGKDVTLVLDLGNGMSWKINGNSITADKLGDINFSVKANSNAVPVEVINKVSGERYTIQVSLAHNGPFGFEAILAVELDAKDAGLYANLFYYNPQTKELEFVGADIITDKGMAEFTFTHASDYVIVIDKVSMDPNANIPAKGTKLTDKKTKAVYKVTKSGKTGGTVEYLKSTDKKATSISIPATVTIDGITYKVTAIAANAFKNNKTVKKITIGKNVTKIGAKAFYGCKKLKSITIKTAKLTSKNVGNDAFKGIATDAKVKVPEKKLDTYQKLLAKKGLGDQATVKK